MLKQLGKGWKDRATGAVEIDEKDSDSSVLKALMGTITTNQTAQEEMLAKIARKLWDDMSRTAGTLLK